MTIHTIEFYSSHLLKFIHSVITDDIRRVHFFYRSPDAETEESADRASGTEPQSVHVIIMYVPSTALTSDFSPTSDDVEA